MKVTYLCTHCRGAINAGENKESSIIISRKCGEQITFKVNENNHIETCGEKLSRFIDPEWYL